MFSDYLAFTAIAILCLSVAMPFIVIMMAQSFDPKAPPKDEWPPPEPYEDPSKRPDGGFRPPNCS